LFSVEALGAFLAGVILVGQLMAVFMAISGGALDNAKKYIEDGHFGGKRSPAHKAAVEGDTVGDPLKDTAGPALNPMIKVVNLVSLLAAPLIVESRGKPAIWLVVAVLAVLLVWGIWQSKKEIDRESIPEPA
jgi:K(+)-stimulated pyrophosphate-energized sodium pump